MKKTLIAMAVAGVVAAPMASADVSIAGHVKQTFTKTDSTTAIDDGDLIGATTSDLKFTASEDLGNGMTASAQMVFDMDQVQAGSNSTMTQNQTVSLSGGFGTVVLGRMEDFTQSKVLAMADVFNGNGSVEPTTGAGRNNGGIAYVSPAMNGLTVGVAGFAVDNSATAGALNDDTFDATDVALMYSNGPLTVNVSREDHDRTAGGTSQIEDITSVGLGYTAGDLSLTAVHSKANYVTFADADDTAIIAKYTMGNNQIVVGWGNDETAGSATSVTDVDETTVELVHNFSSRTKAFVTVYDTDAASGDSVSFGMKHSF